ncbi:MAG: BolA family transcriptional regulator [Loktanella sp.]|jgi:BolA protein|nr:BolA family transcriptional regulator [Yoonia sp.]MDO7558431.1 BolA family transcriptional regulator [Loktanella sp.]MDO7618338.1 BolA family transcriptional regulator [Planktomarina temperata]MDO7623244.1 BolA family transcriptional regulator [Loktanella sp.]MDO7626399.1 BolA family transcriptional regulator [Loktanella sp.]
MGLDIEIKAALEKAFAANTLEVINESHKHSGHSGDDGSGESHWRIVIAAPEFAPMTRIARHRAIHAALGPAIIGRIHALAIDIQ